MQLPSSRGWRGRVKRATSLLPSGADEPRLWPQWTVRVPRPSTS